MCIRDSRGSLCSKGTALHQVAVNPIDRRLTKVQYRRPGGTEWEEITWDRAMDMIAERVKKTRDQTFIAQENGVTAIAVTVGDPGKASEYADFLAHKFMQSRADFAFSAPAYPPEEALKLALGDSCRPVFVSDSGDNPTAGSTGDNTTLIALLSQELSSLARTKKILVAGIFDPCAERICVENFGSEITLKVGGNFDTKHCQPVRLRGIPVKLVNDFGVYRSDLVLFRTAEFDLIITSKHIGFTGTELFSALEIDHSKLDVIVVKLGYLTEEFKTLAAKSYLALTEGCSDEVLARLEYSKKFDLI